MKKEVFTKMHRVGIKTKIRLMEKKKNKLYQCSISDYSYNYKSKYWNIVVMMCGTSVRELNSHYLAKAQST